MALGNKGLTDFTPQKSQTAAKLLTTVSQTPSKKEERFDVRIDGDLIQCFKELCMLNGKKASAAIRDYIEEAVRRGAL